AGGGGSGKSSVAPRFSSNVDFIVDTTLSNKQAARTLFEKIRKSGREFQVLYIHRRFDTAFEHIIRRYLGSKKNGTPRIVPLPVAAAAHIGSQEFVFDNEHIPFKIIDNNGNIDEADKITLDKLSEYRYIQLHETAGESGRLAGRDGRQGDPSLTGGSPERTGTDRQDHSPTGDGTRSEETGRTIEADGHFNQSRETETGGAGGSATAGEAGRDQGRAGAKARLEEAGRAIVESYRERGLLTDAESHAFLGRNSLNYRTTCLR
ncbi:MAG: hypothetical protein EOP84_33030, partial [Verrucomicrobiaceae bacterium]